jgi:UDP-N-acetylmuramoyl-L-alanyl-D-glutamate--2,6-diaminopimelate ligase
MMTLAKKYFASLERLVQGFSTDTLSSTISVSGITIDSRSVKEGDCFVALRGTQTDGAHYIEQAIAAGAAAVLVDAHSEVLIDQDRLSVPIISINQLHSRLSEIAGRFYSNPSHDMEVVAFTGTNGKTTCSLLYAQLLAKAKVSGEQQKSSYIGTTGYGVAESPSSNTSGQPFKTSRSGDIQLTTPDAVSVQRIMAELAMNGTQSVALEASSHSLVQFRLQSIGIDIAVFTNLSRDHLDYHPDLKSYAAAKASLFELPSVQTAIINLDDPVGVEIAANLRPEMQLITFSLDNQVADIHCRQIDLDASGIRALLVTPWGEGEIASSLIGSFNLSNLLAVIAAACARGVTLENCLQLLPELQAAPGRMQSMSANAKPQVIIDYAHTPDALEKALQAIKPFCLGQLWLVFGCGGNRDKGKRIEMGKVADQFADRIIITNDNPRFEQPEQIAEQILQGIDGDVTVELDRRRAISTSILQAEGQDIVLIAGKGHEDYQIVGDTRLPFSDQQEALIALEAAQASREHHNKGGVS